MTVGRYTFQEGKSAQRLSIGAKWNGLARSQLCRPGKIYQKDMNGEKQYIAFLYVEEGYFQRIFEILSEETRYGKAVDEFYQRENISHKCGCQKRTVGSESIYWYRSQW